MMYRGVDNPRFGKVFGKPSYRGSKKNAVLAIPNQGSNDEAYGRFFKSEIQSELQSDETQADPRDVTVLFLPCTQRPAIEIQLAKSRDSTGSAQSKVTCTIWGTSLAGKDGVDADIGVKFHRCSTALSSSRGAFLDCLPIDETQLPGGVHPSPQLVQVDLLLAREVSTPSESASKPTWKGVSQEERAELIQRFMDGDNTLTLFERAIVHFSHATHLWVFFPVSQSTDTNDFSAFMRTICFAAKTYGNHWFYRLDSGQSIATPTPQALRTHLSVPRWLVIKWRIWKQLNENREEVITRVEPIVWTAYKDLELDAYPDPVTLAFELSASEARRSSNADTAGPAGRGSDSHARNEFSHVAIQVGTRKRKEHEDDHIVDR